MSQQMVLSKFPVISERLRLRKERHCVLAIDRISGWYWELPPSQALIVALFTGIYTVNMINEIVASIYSIPKEKALEAIRDTIALLHDNHLVTLQDSPVEKKLPYHPREFLYNAEQNASQVSPRYNGPLAIEMMLTDACNFQCIYCYMDAKCSHKPSWNNQMDFGFFREIAQQARDLEVKKAFLSGGEPFLSKDIVQMVELLLDYDIFPYISTNGSMLNKSVINQLHSAGLSFIQLSLDTCDPLTFDILTGTKSFFSQVDKNLRLMKDRGMEIRVKSVITKKNWHQVETLIDYCYDLELLDMEIVPCLPSVDGRAVLSSLILNNEELTALKEIVENKQAAYQEHFPIRYQNPQQKWRDKKPGRQCGGGISSLLVFPDGRAGICDMITNKEEFIVGNLKDRSLSQIWNSEQLNRIRNIPEALLCPECRDCQHLDECRTGCFNLSKMVYGDYYAPDPHCPVRFATPC